jgi:hypothetical protein
VVGGAFLVTHVLTYLVPLHTAATHDISDLAQYLDGLRASVGEIIVVDGSDPSTFLAHRNALHLGIDMYPPDERTVNGKVGNVVTGLRRARYEKVVIADDDVRYTPAQLAQVAARLDEDDVVRPQNYFDALPWHAYFDTARTLFARATGGDWPGTLGVRRSLALPGYAGDTLFENLELVRTIRARGGTEAVALGLFVARHPPSTRHFASQQIRQAYDEFARPVRLVVSLAALPLVASLLVRRRVRPAVAALLSAMVVAEAGRRRAGGHRVFPFATTLLAPFWLLWRSGCSWLAVGARLRGGVRYRGTRVRRAASPRYRRRRRVTRASSSRARFHRGA